MEKTKKQFTAIKIFRGYLIIILIGTVLLSMPFASKLEYDNFFLRVFHSLFTATSATCVTGLTVVPTGDSWTFFGQLVILLMIQIGGLGFMMVIYLIATFIRKKITLHERKTIMQAQGFLNISGIIQLLKHILKFTFVFELLGFLLLLKPMLNTFGTTKDAVWYAIFTSISAFCNAGFDPFPSGISNSVIAFNSNPLVILTLAGLIISGGLGFVVWDDLFGNKFRFKRLKLHSKIVLVTSGILLFVPSILFFVFEHNGAFANLSFGNQIMASFFQSTTCRTAGFAAIDQATLSDPSILLSSILMFIGGSSGSTAGGIKTTTIAVLFLSILSTTLKLPSLKVGKRQIEPATVRNASAILSFYIFLAFTAITIIMAIEQSNTYVGFRETIFEVASAIGTVGLSAAGTVYFSIGSQAIIIILMFVGRLGALSIIALFREKSESGQSIIQVPTEQIVIG